MNRRIVETRQLAGRLRDRRWRRRRTKKEKCCADAAENNERQTCRCKQPTVRGLRTTRGRGDRSTGHGWRSQIDEGVVEFVLDVADVAQTLLGIRFEAPLEHP